MIHRGNGWAALAALLVLLLVTGCASETKKPRRGAAPATTTRAQTTRPSIPSIPPSSRSRDDVSKSQSQRYKDANDSGPSFPPSEVAKLVEPVPKSEPRSRYGNKSTYSVLGKEYHVLDSPVGYVERGISSWYGNKFHGYMTSSMEPYDMHLFSAAHKSLPLPSYARVTNLSNGKSVIVRVNDRGPFHENRLIDLSYAAAVRIGIWPKGTGLVEVQAIDPEHPERRPVAVEAPTQARAAEARPASTKPASDGARLYLQVGSFGARDNAERVAAALKSAGIEPVRIDTVNVSGNSIHRVRVGPLAGAAGADALARRLQQLGFSASRVVVDD
ncbi:MAG: septal ring lytic transglycosylase RlpA family protein [Dokdonella sp.]